MNKTPNRTVPGISRTTRRLIVCSVLVLFLLPGCSPRKLMVGELAAMVQTGLPAFEQEDDLVLLADAFPSQIKLLETVLVSDPGNETLLVLLSRLCGGYAFAILETRWEALAHHQPDPLGRPAVPEQLAARMSRYFQKGARYALEALEQRHPGIQSRMSAPRDLAGVLGAMQAGDLSALFWYAFNLALYIQHNQDSVRALSDAHQVETIMKWVLKADPAYYQGNANLVLLAFYGSRPPMMGGNPELAEYYYREHRRLRPEPDRLRQLFRARYNLVGQHDKTRFCALLTKTCAPPADGETVGLLDRVAIQRAAIYLKAADDFFDE